MYRIVGIDPGLQCTGVCIFSSEKGSRIFSVKRGKKDGSDFDRQKSIVREIGKTLRRNDLLVFEDFGDVGRFRPSGKYVERVELAGMMKYVFETVTRLPYIIVRPSHLKSFIAGRSDTPKEVVKNAVEQRWGITVSNHDEADAVSLALIGWALINGLEAEKMKGKKAVFEKIKNWRSNPACLHRINFVQPIALAK